MVSSLKPVIQSTHEKNIRQIPIKGDSRKHLTCLLNTVNSLKNKEKLKNSEGREVYGDITNKCHMLFWMGMEQEKNIKQNQRKSK